MWQSFYEEGAHLGNKFGVKGPLYGPKGHLGVDFNKHPSGTPIPSWTAGVVTSKFWSTKLGNLVVLRRGDGTYAGFCHMKNASPLRVGQRVAVGDIVGLVGSSGLYSTGPHLHTTLEPTGTIGTQNAMDPLPYIRQAVAHGGRPERKKNKVTLFYTVKDKKNLFALAGDSPGTSANWLETTDQNLANQLAAQHGNAALLSNASFQAWKSAYLEPVKTLGPAAGPTALPKGFVGTFTD